VFAYFDGQRWQSLNDTLSTPWAQKVTMAPGSQNTAALSPRETAAARESSQESSLSITPSKTNNEYRITLEPHNNHWLFTLDTPSHIQEGFYLTADDELLSRELVNQPLQYALPINSANASHPAVPDGRYLRMPNLYGSKTQLLVKRLQKDLNPDLPYDRQFVTKVLEYFRQQPFFYSKQPPLTKYDPVDEFITKTKTGFCEHYASAFAFMMRAAGIPSRIATGYLGGEYNAVGDYIVVRQSNAHAWTEVWLQGLGWVRVDPTAVLPPHRVDTSGADQAYLLAGFIAWDSAALVHLRAWLDNLSYHWYGFLANVLQARNQNWLSWFFGNKHYVLVLALFILSTWLAWRLWKRDAVIADPVLRTYDHFCRKMARQGFHRSQDESASGFAARVSAQQPDWESHVQIITHLYNQLRYGRNPCRTAYKQFCREVGQFRP
jgi:transglutaminase-like putative cysteine protease